MRSIKATSTSISQLSVPRYMTPSLIRVLFIQKHFRLLTKAIISFLYYDGTTYLLPNYYDLLLVVSIRILTNSISLILEIILIIILHNFRFQWQLQRMLLGFLAHNYDLDVVVLKCWPDGRCVALRQTNVQYEGTYGRTNFLLCRLSLTYMKNIFTRVSTVFFWYFIRKGPFKKAFEVIFHKKIPIDIIKVS